MSTPWSYLLITICLRFQLMSADANAPEGEAQCRRPYITDRERISEYKEYYTKGEEITIQCIEGYYTSTNTTRCENPGTDSEWTSRIFCTALCRKPDGGILKMDPDKFFYNIGDTVTVKCPVGYHNHYPSVQCVNQGSYIDWSDRPQCTVLCMKPNGETLTMDPEKTFYNFGDTVTVICSVGYLPFPPSVQCVRFGSFHHWNKPPQCKPLCRNLGGRILKMDPEKTFYNISETVKVKCPDGYWNPYPSVQCVNRGSSIEWNYRPQCMDYCKKPILGNVASFYVNKRHYNRGELITVQCMPGYYPTSETMKCDYPGFSLQWTPPTITCLAQCKKPAIDNVDSLSVVKEYYKKGDSIQIRCKDGYYPTSSSMRCNNPHSSQEWTSSKVTCVGVTFMDWRVTSTSIGFHLSCTPQCPDTWRFTVELCPDSEIGYSHDRQSCKDLYVNSGTFTNLQPFSGYNIRTKLFTGDDRYYLENKVIWTDDSVPGQPEILNVPSMEDNTIRWSLSEEWGIITGFQMNISARRDYDVSFAMDESLQFPPNVREYKIPLQYGTNYTITLRGFTTSGAEEDTTENIETDIGDPPLHMEKTIRDDTLQLYPVSNMNGPIRSYEIIVFGGQEGNSTKECLTFKTTPYHFIWSPTRYTAAVFPAENLTEPRSFTYGDDHHYNGFHNAPLIPNHNYTVYIRVTSRWKHVEKSSCAFAGVIEGVTGSSLIPVSSLGIIIGLLVLILLVLVGFTVVQSTPWMKQKLLRGKRKRGEAENNICIQDTNYQETCENPTGAEDKI